MLDLNPKSATSTAIEFSEVGTAYQSALQRPILQGVNLKVYPGEFVALLGRNGAGKSTLLRSLVGLTPIQQGAIHIGGVRLTPQTLLQMRQRMGMLFQGGGLIPQLSALDNVLCGLLGTLTAWQSLWGFSQRDRSLALDLLERLGLQEQAHQKTNSLSGGEKQRVAIARTLIQSPDILLADEPTTGLDVTSNQQVMNILANLHQEQGMTIVTVLHDLSLAAKYSQRAIILDQGQITYDGSCYDLPAQFARA